MNATTTPAALIPVTVGSGKAVHAATDYDGHLGVDCGAVRYRNITTRSITRQRPGTEVTCTKCLKAAAAAQAEAATQAGRDAALENLERNTDGERPVITDDRATARRRPAAAAAVREEVTATVTAEAPAAEVHAFTASADSRSRCTCGASRNSAAHGYTKAGRTSAARTGAETAAAKAQAVTAKQDAVAAAAQAGEDAVAAVYAAAAERRAQADEDQRAAEEAGAADAARIQAIADAPADLRTATAAELAEKVNSGALSFTEAASMILTGRTVLAAASPAATVSKPAKAKAPKVTAPAAPAEPQRSLWVAAAFVPIILADTAPGRASLVAKVDASVPNARGGRTIRVTAAEAAELSAIGTEIETAAVTSGDKAAGRMAHSARTMRDRLAALFA